MFKKIFLPIKNKMNFLWILLLLFFFFVLFVFILKQNSQDFQEEQTVNNIKEPKILSSKYHPITTKKMISYSYPPNSFYPKWGGVQRNPVCCRIDHMNRGFYDAEMYP
jgi:hypothetical protein